MRPTHLFALALVASLSTASFAQQSVTVRPYMASIETDLKSVPTGNPFTLDVFLMDATSMAPSEGLSVTADLTMPSMAGMMLDKPKVTKGEKPGHYNVEVTLPHMGEYRLELHVKGVTLAFELTPGGSMDHGMEPMGGMHGMEMKGSLGDWPMNREGSGTSWQPDSSPMFMKMLPSALGFDWSVMGTMQAGYSDDNSPRGSKGFFTDSMAMLMGSRKVGGGTLGFNFMTSLDPVINGEKGVPDLFQTGETANGVPLVDRQHPHNLFSELALTYSHPISRDWSGFVYGGPVGEPALGNVMFMHRASGLEIPLSPITHHWFDSTHISFGVVTAGLVYANKWKLEGSVFNGQEPGENRYTIGPVALNSASGRLSYNPSKDWSLSASYGYLKSPEALAPGEDQHRTTASIAYSHEFSPTDSISATVLWGQRLQEGSSATNAYLAEATYFHAKDALFARFENVDEDELFQVPAGTYNVSKLVFGDVHNFYSHDQFDYGFGVYAGLYTFPGSLEPLYGKHPVSLGVFLRIRPSKM
ncbi:MAG TPA: FixH family protein [Fimbriimonas sp.]|nr:FixH family protein [Fimbriimonas sp.]